jgi:hypothetical protein
MRESTAFVSTEVLYTNSIHAHFSDRLCSAYLGRLVAGGSGLTAVLASLSKSIYRPNIRAPSVRDAQKASHTSTLMPLHCLDLRGSTTEQTWLKKILSLDWPRSRWRDRSDRAIEVKLTRHRGAPFAPPPLGPNHGNNRTTKDRIVKVTLHARDGHG